MSMRHTLPSTSIRHPCLTYQPTNPPTHTPIYPPIYPPTHTPTFLPIYPPTHPPTFLPTYLPTHPPTHPPTHQPTYLPTSLPSNPKPASTHTTYAHTSFTKKTRWGEGRRGIHTTYSHLSIYLHPKTRSVGGRRGDSEVCKGGVDYW